MGANANIPAITAQDAGQRLDNFLIKNFSKLPKTLLYRMIRKGEVRVNSKRVGPFYRMVAGDQLRLPPKLLHYDPKEKLAIAHIPNKLISKLNDQILFEDDQLIVINKPPGLAVHSGSSVAYGLIEVLKAAWPQYPHIELVHRLDKGTSGCIMLAKSRQSLVCLHTLLKQNQIHKRYYALVKGHWQGGKIVCAPLARMSGKYSERLVKVEANGDESTTHFTVVKYFPNATLLCAKPITGRTHQIRVHASYMGHPIIGDDKYGCKKTNEYFKDEGFDRLFLHAHQLDIPMPDKQKIKVEAPLPGSFTQLIEFLK